MINHSNYITTGTQQHQHQSTTQGTHTNVIPPNFPHGPPPFAHQPGMGYHPMGYFIPPHLNAAISGVNHTTNPPVAGGAPPFMPGYPPYPAFLPPGSYPYLRKFIFSFIHTFFFFFL